MSCRACCRLLCLPACRCDFTPIYEYHMAERERKKSLPKEVRACLPCLPCLPCCALCCSGLLLVWAAQGLLLLLVVRCKGRPKRRCRCLSVCACLVSMLVLLLLPD